MVLCFCYIPGGRALTGSGPAFQKTYIETKRFGLILGLSSGLQFLLGIWCASDPKSSLYNDDVDGRFVFWTSSAINTLILLFLWCKGAHPHSSSSSTEAIYVCYNRLRYFGVIAILFHVYMIICLVRMRFDSNMCYGTASSCENITYMPSLPTSLGLALFVVGVVGMCSNFPSNPESSATSTRGQYAPVTASAVVLAEDSNDIETGSLGDCKSLPTAEAIQTTNVV